MVILVATGSFKDVFNPIEAAEVIRNALSPDNESVLLPFCDGGEYTYEVLKHNFSFYHEITARNVVNPYGISKDTGYLINGDEAHLVSSSILRLYPEEDKYKNPLMLTDYGYGQMIADAIQKGCKKLFLYIGGVSTACCGFGLIQALGAKLYTKNEQLIPAPCRGKDLLRINRIDTTGLNFQDIEIQVVADGNSKVDALPGITALKVGKSFSEQKETIVSELMKGIENVISLTEISPTKDFTGAAGGLIFGLEQVFPSICYTLGGLFFNRVFGLEEMIEKADLVITGEGRYDNTADGKGPCVITRLAKKHGKPAVLVCGQHEKSKIPVYTGGIVDCRGDELFQREGITEIITGQEYYDEIEIPQQYEDCISLYKKQTPVLLKQLFRRAEL